MRTVATLVLRARDGRGARADFIEQARDAGYEPTGTEVRVYTRPAGVTRLEGEVFINQEEQGR